MVQHGQKGTIGGAMVITKGAQVELLEGVIFRANVASSHTDTAASGGAL